MRLRPISAVLAVSIFRPGLPISNVPGASCGPWANSSSAVGARSMRCRVRLATIHDGRSLITLKLMLLGVKPSDCSSSSGSSGGGSKFAGKMPAVPSRRTVSMRPANCVRSVSVMPNLVEEIGRAGLVRARSRDSCRPRPRCRSAGGRTACRRMLVRAPIGVAIGMNSTSTLASCAWLLNVARDRLEADVVESDLVVLVFGVPAQ